MKLIFLGICLSVPLITRHTRGVSVHPVTALLLFLEVRWTFPEVLWPKLNPSIGRTLFVCNFNPITKLFVTYRLHLSMCILIYSPPPSTIPTGFCTTTESPTWSRESMKRLWVEDIPSRVAFTCVVVVKWNMADPQTLTCYLGKTILDCLIHLPQREEDLSNHKR